MVMTPEAAADQATALLKQQDSDREQLDVIRLYWTGRQQLPLVIPRDAPREIHEMARKARVNIIKIVVESITQSMIVDSMRATDSRADPIIAAAWDIWQRNGMDRRQFGVTRATTAYGTGYMTVLPGTPVPVLRPVGPRQMTAMFSPDDDVWPELAFERQSANVFRLIDNQAIYPMIRSKDGDRLEPAGEHRIHEAKYGGLPVCPVIRFTDVVDLDLDDEPEQTLPLAMSQAPTTTIVAGQVAPLIELQDQMNLTSFSLKAAEWYLAFRQRWIVGKKLNAEERVQSAGSQLWSIEDDPDRVQLGEFGQTELRGYIESRAETAKFAAVLSQTPVHELVGELVNLSAEALAAAEIGRDRMVGERKTGQAEAYEQALAVAVGYGGRELPVDTEMIYRDTSARAFGAVVDGLGKLAQMLSVPAAELWEKIPGATRQDVERWKKAAAEAPDPMADVASMLDRQAGGTRRDSGLILPPGVQA